MSRVPPASLAVLAALAIVAPPALAAPAPEAEGDRLALFAGRSQVIHTTAPLVRVAVSDPNVMDVRVLAKDQLLVQARKPGRSSLHVWTKGAPAKAYEVAVGLDAEEVERQVRRVTGNASLSVAFNGQAFVLAGEAATPEQRDAAKRLAGAWGQPVVDVTSLPQRTEQIAIDVHVVELSKTAGLRLGTTLGGGEVTEVTGGIRKFIFKAGEVMTGEAAAGNLASFGQIDFLALKLEALARRGEAKLLARPTLVTSNGGTAKFLAGGEIPVPVPQALGQTTIVWKEFGVRLEVQPAMTADGRIALAVKPEVSSLDFANGVKQQSITIPAIRTRRADTQVTLAPGETLMLGGLLGNERNRDYDQLPFLGDLPVLGELFKSRRFLDNETELAIMVTPRLTAPNAPTKGVLDDVRRELEGNR
jgi:pilus assembly protein CpaC